MNVVLDTNVLVSALKTQGGNCATILDWVIEGTLTLCVNANILAEYRRVCHEPRLKLHLGRIQTVLDYVRDRAESVAALPSDIEFPDSDDRPFFDVARHANAVLVTGNKKHFPVENVFGVEILAPSEFMAKIKKHPPEV